MARRRQQINMTVEFEEGDTVDLAELADAYAGDLLGGLADALQRWGDQVDDAVAASKRLTMPMSSPRVDEREIQKLALDAQIAMLLKQREALEAPVAHGVTDQAQRRVDAP